MTAEGSVMACHTVDEWDEHLRQANTSMKLVVADFTASWCPPCRFIAPVFADLAKKFINVVFLKVDVDELPTVAQDWGVEAMPTFIIMKEGTILERIVGADKDKLMSKVAHHS